MGGRKRLSSPGSLPGRPKAVPGGVRHHSAEGKGCHDADIQGYSRLGRTGIVRFVEHIKNTQRFYSFEAPEGRVNLEGKSGPAECAEAVGTY